MAIYRITLADIETEILDAMGFSASTAAPWGTAAKLYNKINLTGQKIAQKAADVMRSEGKLSREGTPRFDMWKTTISSTASTGVTNFVIASGSSAILMPNNYDHWVSFYDTNEERFIYPIEHTHSERYRRFKRKSPGPIEAIEIQGMNSVGAQRNAEWMPVPVGVPAVDMEYYRLPATMPGSSPGAEYPDADYKFHYLWVLEPLLLLMRSDEPSYTRYLEQEQELIRQLAATARSI